MMTRPVAKTGKWLRRVAGAGLGTANHTLLEGMVMLVLTRKRSEMIQIGEDIVIKVIKTANGTVKLGIDAPAHVRVMRAELLGEGHAAKYGPAVPGMHKPVGSPIPASVPVPSDQFPQPHVA